MGCRFSFSCSQLGIQHTVWGPLLAQAVKKHKNAGEGRAQKSSWDDKMMGNYEEELKKICILINYNLRWRRIQ